MLSRLRFLLLAILIPISIACSPAGPAATASNVLPAEEWAAVRAGIQAQRQAGFPDYNPEWLYVVDPATQRMHVISLRTMQVSETLRCGTGKAGLGEGDSQTPTGFFTMGGVRIAKNADTSIQTGDSKKGVSGVYAEILYPPSHPDPTKRGMVPNGVVIHSYNPATSEMLRQRRAQNLIGRVPCTTGCPVLDTDEVRKLVPYLQRSAGKFDPTANPNATLQNSIRTGQVKLFERDQLGAAIYIRNRS